MRAAINLTGVHHTEIVRGHEIATPGYLKRSHILTVRLHVLPSSPWPVKHRMHVRVHIGTAEILASISLLEGNVIERGQWGKAQLFLSEPAVASWGQPFVIRSESPMVTVGGGQVLQPVARRVRRRDPKQIARLDGLWSDHLVTRASTAITFYGLEPWSDFDLARDTGIGPDRVSQVVSELIQQGELIDVALGRRVLRLPRELVGDLEARAMHAIDRLHQQNPLHATIPAQRVVGSLDYLGDDALVLALIERLKGARKLRGDERSICRTDWVPKLSPAERKLREQVLAAYELAGFQPPDPAELQKQAVTRATAVQPLVELLVAEGHLAHIGGSIYLHSRFADELRNRVSSKLRETPAGLTVGDIRDLLSITRKHALPYCEYLDRIGLTRREGDLRVLASDAAAPDNSAQGAPCG
jgi:selenocysteine-specific elongation factor